jgi:hypothetical protein
MKRPASRGVFYCDVPVVEGLLQRISTRAQTARGGLGQLFVAQEIALNHHERWDGTGYPHRVRGKMIPMSARITALSDVYDALTHKRSYKDAWSIEDAVREIGSLRGKHFDPELTDIFLELVPELIAAHGNLDAYLGADAKKSHFIANRERVEPRTKDRPRHVRRSALTARAVGPPLLAAAGDNTANGNPAIPRRYLRHRLQPYLNRRAIARWNQIAPLLEPAPLPSQVHYLWSFRSPRV